MVRDPAALFQPGELGDYARFARNALRRNRFAAAFTFAAVVFVGATAAHFLPKRYDASAVLLAVPADTSATAQQAKENPQADALAAAITRHDQLEGIVDDLQLVQRWDEGKPAIYRVLDGLRSRVGLGLDAKDTRKAIVATLEHRLAVEVEGGHVTVHVVWYDAELAREIALAAQQRFLASRRTAEVASTEAVLGSLTSRVPEADARIQQAMAAVTSAQQAKRRGAKASSVGALQAEGRWRDLPDPELAKLRLDLIARRRQVEELETGRRRRLAELNSKLAEAKVTYGPAHPALVELQQELSSLDRASPEVEAIKADEQRLLAAFVERGGKEVDLTEQPASAWPTDLDAQNPDAELAKARLSLELQRYGALRDAIATAELAVTNARSSFEQRYAVIDPPELPRSALGPSPLLLILAALIVGAFAAAFVAIARDVFGNKVLEAWQLERTLGLELIGEVERR